MDRQESSRKIRRRDEERLIKIASESLSFDFANPERLECPGSAALKALARRRLSNLKTDELVDHVATCAPCFAEYSRYRDERRRQSIVELISVFVLVAICVGLFVRFARFAIPFIRPNIATEARTRVVTLDLRDSSPARSAADQTPPAPKRLTRGDLELSIHLPIGTDDGTYSIELKSLDGASVVSATGVAHWDGVSEVLLVRFDLRKVRSGEYNLLIRKHQDPSQRVYRLIVG